MYVATTYCDVKNHRGWIFLRWNKYLFPFSASHQVPEPKFFWFSVYGQNSPDIFCYRPLDGYINLFHTFHVFPQLLLYVYIAVIIVIFPQKGFELCDLPIVFVVPPIVIKFTSLKA